MDSFGPVVLNLHATFQVFQKSSTKDELASIWLLFQKIRTNTFTIIWECNQSNLILFITFFFFETKLNNDNVLFSSLLSAKIN